MNKENLKKLMEIMKDIYPNITELEINNYIDEFLNRQSTLEIISNFICYSKRRVE